MPRKKGTWCVYGDSWLVVLCFFASEKEVNAVRAFDANVVIVAVGGDRFTRAVGGLIVVLASCVYPFG